MYRVEITIISKNGTKTKTFIKCDTLEKVNQVIGVKRVYSFEIKVFKITEEVVYECKKNC